MLKSQRRGVAIFHILIIIGLMVVFTLTLTSLAAFHYQSVMHQEELLEAREGAQSGLADAARQIAANPAFGTNNESFTGTLGNVTYSVTFKAGGVPWSTNNLNGFTSVAGYGGRTVPPHCAHIVSSATANQGEHRSIEAIVNLQSLDYPLESTGTITGDTITVAGAASLAAYIASGAKAAASVYSGSSSNSAVSMTGVSAVSGDVVTVGLASLGPSVIVGGKVLGGSSAQQVPNLNISSFDNSSVPGVVTIASGTYDLLLNPIGGPVPGTATFKGPVYIDGSVHLINGVVNLQQASVYVANGGDFQADGAVLGQGSIFCTGKTTVGAGTVLQNDEEIALFSEKDISITLGGVFQGVLYSHANVTIGTGIVCLGAVISQGDTDTSASLQMGSGSKIISIPEYNAFASYSLAQGGTGAPVKQLYWGELP